MSRSYEHTCTNKINCTSPLPNFHVLKYACATAAREVRDVAIINLAGFFLQIKADKEDDTIVKLIGVVALFLVECNEK